jgi:hypothetical protein
MVEVEPGMKLYKTETGHAAFKERSSLFAGRQRSLYILFDGKKTVAEVLQAAASLGMGQTDVDYLLAIGFLAEHPTADLSASASAPLSDFAAPALQGGDSGRTEQQRYTDAKPLATQLTAGLGLRGLMLNLAVESAAGYPDLIRLLPKIQAAVGTTASRKLYRALYD